jgi:hypothetical protein
MAAGIIFASLQPFNPPDVLASVTTDAWAIVHAFKLAMCVLFVVGITGLYARQVEAAGRLGLAGYLMFGLSWMITTSLVFTQLFINPLLATASPAFVESFLGMVNGHPGEMNIGAIPALHNVAGLLYALGGLVFGIATFRADILPRRAAALLAIGAVAPIVLAMLPHPLDRTLAVPMGLAMAWLGTALWSERRVLAPEPTTGRASPQFLPTGAE